MTEIIKTLNSTYEVDWDANLVRRLRGAHEPTSHQSADGEWQQAIALHTLPVYGGQVLRMAWDVNHATISSLITERTTPCPE